MQLEEIRSLSDLLDSFRGEVRDEYSKLAAIDKAQQVVEDVVERKVKEKQ